MAHYNWLSGGSFAADEKEGEGKKGNGTVRGQGGEAQYQCRKPLISVMIRAVLRIFFTPLRRCLPAILRI